MKNSDILPTDALLQVAILCNHQRSVSKTHGAQMEKLEGKLAELTVCSF